MKPVINPKKAQPRIDIYFSHPGWSEVYTIGTAAPLSHERFYGFAVEAPEAGAGFGFCPSDPAGSTSARSVAADSILLPVNWRRRSVSEMLSAIMAVNSVRALPDWLDEKASPGLGMSVLRI